MSRLFRWLLSPRGSWLLLLLIIVVAIPSLTFLYAATGQRGFTIIRIVGVVVGAAVTFAGLRVASKQKVHDGHCPACGYDLRETRRRCPECGWAMLNPPFWRRR